MNKYKLLTKEVKEEYGIKFYRIEALKDFSDVKKGDKGGWIEKEDNLSQDNNAWVSGNAWVYGNARVYGNAWVYGNAQVYGNARVYGNALVYGNAQVFGDAWVYGNAQVYGNARVSKKIKLVGGYFYHTKRKSEKIESVDTYDDDYETLACEPKIDEQKPANKRVKIRSDEGTIIEGELI